jgi:hypothetical protein
VGDLRIAVLYLLQNSLPKGSVEKSIEPRGVCAHSIVVKRYLVGGHGQRFIETIDVGIVDRSLPRPVRAKYDSLCHAGVPPRFEPDDLPLRTLNSGKQQPSDGGANVRGSLQPFSRLKSTPVPSGLELSQIVVAGIDLLET